MDIFDLMAVIKLDTSQYEKGLSDSEGKMSTFASKLGGGMKTAAAVGTAAVGAMAAGVSAASAAVVKGTSEVAAYGDDIEKTAQKMGFSFQGYQEWDAIMEHNGSSIKSVRTAMQTLSKQVSKNSEAFKELGISESELASMNQEELFEKVISGLQDMGEGTERTALATQLLGRGSKELGPLLNMTSEETEQMRQRVHELGGVMSDEAVEASAKYQDTLQDMNTAVDGIKRNLMSSFLPSVTNVMEGITEIFGGNMDDGLEIIQNGISSFISTLSEKIPKVIETANGIISALIQAISDNLPQIMKAGVSMLTTLLSGIINNLPALVGAATEAVATLASGIGEALPDLIPAAVDAMLTIVDTLIDNMPLLIDAALQLMVGLAEGLVKAIPKIIERIPEIISSIISALINSIPKIAQAGFDLITSLVRNLPSIIANIVSAVPKIISGIVGAIGNGFAQMVQAGANLIGGLGDGLIKGVRGVVDKARQVAGNILGAVKGFFGIASPSKVFAQLGGFMMEGLANGIDDGTGLVQDAIDDVNDALYDGLEGGEFSDSDMVTTVNTTSSSDVSGGMTNTDSLLNDILQKMDSMSVLLDGGVIAGHITSDINTNLGAVSYYQNREAIAL